MKRSKIRELKQLVSTGLRPAASTQETDQARAAALELLDWSVKCGHHRLAILRLEAALKAGARVPYWQLRYCQRVIERADIQQLPGSVASALQDRGKVRRRRLARP